MWRLDGIWHRVATWHRNEIELMINLISFSTWTHFTNFQSRQKLLNFKSIFFFVISIIANGIWVSVVPRLWVIRFWFGASDWENFQNWFPSEAPPVPLSGSPAWSDTGRTFKQRVSFYRSTTIIFFRKDFKSMHINQNYELDLNIKC